MAAAALGLVVLLPGVAQADTSAASAMAGWVALTGGTELSTGWATVSNNGSQGTVTAGSNPPMSALGSQSIITAGTLTQRSAAFADGRSAACAGLVGAGGAVTIGPDGTCLVTPGTGGVEISLSSTLRIRADAITSACTASSEGTVTAKATLANAALYTVVLGTATKALPLAVNPAPNSGVSSPLLSSVATVGTNTQISSGAGHVMVTALDVKLLGSAAAARIGFSQCGTNVRVLPTPALPMHALPLTGAGIVVVGWALLARRVVRRRSPRLGVR